MGDVQLTLFGGRGAGVKILPSEGADSWKYYHNSKAGYGGSEQSWFTGTGSMTVALALPYVGSGNHGKTPVWAGFQSNFYADDSISERISHFADGNSDS